MAFDLDEDELRATREMHKLSDKNVASEEDIKILNNYLKNSAYKESNSDFFKNGGWEIVDLEVPQAIEHLLQDYKRQKQINKELEIDLTIVYLKGIEDGKDKYEQKIKNKIKEIGNEDLGVYDTDSEDVVIAKYEHRAVLDTLNELLQESEDK